jgi:hypothetical protein
MPDLTLSAAMDSFLSEEDPANVFLPLAGGTMDSGADINFANASRLREGLTDAGNGGAGGIAMVCSLDYEFKWEAGRLYVMGQDGFTIRVEMFGFTAVPTATDDDTKGYIVGSRRILDSGVSYTCTDSTTDAAVWQLDSINLVSGQGIYWSDVGENAYLEATGDSMGVGNVDEFYINAPFSANEGINVAEGYGINVDYIYDGGVPLNYLSMVDGEIGQYSGISTPSINWVNRTLHDAAGTESASFGNSNFQISAADGLVVTNGLRELTSTLIIDLTNRQLIDSSGAIALDWSSYLSTSMQFATTSYIDASLGYVSSGYAPAALPYGAIFSPTAVASLPATPAEGTVCYVNDADTPAIGSAVVDGSTDKCLVCYNGTDWIVTSLL